MEKPPRLYCLSLEAATTPPESGQTTCISNAWWVVHPEKGIVLYR
jgi:hypothetical protein